MRRLVCLACAALMILSACNREPTPIEPRAKSSTSDAAPSANANSKLKPPTLPAAAKRNDETGAANFVLYWVKVSDYAANTGETELLREVSSATCEGCNRYIALYEKTYADGGWIRGGMNTLRDVTVEPSGASFIVRAQVHSGIGSFKPSRSAPVKPTPSERIKVSYAASRSGDNWSMSQVGLER